MLLPMAMPLNQNAVHNPEPDDHNHPSSQQVRLRSPHRRMLYNVFHWWPILRSTSDTHQTSHLPLASDLCSAGGGRLPGPVTQRHQTNQQINTGIFWSANDAFRDAILLDLDMMHRIPRVAESVNGILVAYETQAKQITSQGKLHSGCFNIVDAATMNPEVRRSFWVYTHLRARIMSFLMIKPYLKRWPVSCQTFITRGTNLGILS